MIDLQSASAQREWGARPSRSLRHVRVFGVSPNAFAIPVPSSQSVPYSLGASATEIRVYRCPSVVKNSFLQSPVKVSQGQSRLFKATQAYSRVFGKKNCLFFVHRPDSFRPVTALPLPYGKERGLSQPQPGKHSRVPKAFQPIPRCSKPFQAIFRKKKIVYFLFGVRARPRHPVTEGEKTATLQS